MRPMVTLSDGFLLRLCLSSSCRPNFREYIATLAAVRRSVLEVVPRVVPAQSYADLLFRLLTVP